VVGGQAVGRVEGDGVVARLGGQEERPVAPSSVLTRSVEEAGSSKNSMATGLEMAGSRCGETTRRACWRSWGGAIRRGERSRAWTGDSGEGRLVRRSRAGTEVGL
jgi:hypothetical protein